MPDHELMIKLIGTVVVAAPLLLMFALGVSSLIGRPLAERLISRAVATTVLTGLTASLTILGTMLWLGTRYVPIELGSWVHIPDYHFSVKLVFDRLSVPLVILSFILCGTIGAFASRYLHRERGFNRFHVFYALFLLGMVVTSLAGTIETLFAGWELVGLSSALLVAFHFERAAPCRNGLRVWTVYRISDAALLIAAVVMHHLTGEGDFQKLVGADAWPDGTALVTQHQALVVGLLLLLAAAGKSALVPFSGWLPRAMEGPTPSSAVFYGALSVHLGAFLLLRVSPIIELSAWLQAAIVSIGLLTSLYATVVGRVQTDIKTALVLRLPDAGRSDRGRDRYRPAALHSAGPYPGPRLSALAAIRSRAVAAVGLPHAGKRHRGPPDATAQHLGTARAGPPAHAVLSPRDRAGLPRCLAHRGHRHAADAILPTMRRAGVPLDGIPFRPQARSARHAGAVAGAAGRSGMSELHLPWLEIAILCPLVGASFTVRFRESDVARKWCVWFTALTLLCATARGSIFMPCTWSRPAIVAISCRDWPGARC